MFRCFKVHDENAEIMTNTSPNEIAPRWHVMLVDDDEKILRFAQLGLTLSGYKVTSAISGEQALKFLELEKPDIVVLDMLMPIMDGFEVLKRIRAQSNIPVIAFSAHTASSEKALDFGASRFIPKPFRPEELVTAIEYLLKR